MLHYLKLMIQILMAPRSGWEDVMTDNQAPRNILLRGLAPLAAIAALSVGMGVIYQHDATPEALIINAIVTFARYFLTYFIAISLLNYVLPRFTADGTADRHRVELLAAYCTGMMALIGILENVLPMEIPLLRFLPLYIVVVIIQSRWFLNIDEKCLFRFAACAIAGIILPVFIIDRILLPS